MKINESESANKIDNANSGQDKYLAALDIGSNSFHFVFARIVDNHLQILHSEKYRVRLAQGLSEDSSDQFTLNQETIARGVQALTDMAPLVTNLTVDNFKVVATYTLRSAKNANAFLNAAADVFPFDIEVISGHEEARLIYQGVAHYSAPDKRRLVIDIGGGSTECVIGENFNTLALTSLNIGCVSFKRMFFADGNISKKRFKQAITYANQEIEAHVKRFKKVSWQSVLGTSGTIKAISQLVNAELAESNIQPESISLIKLHQLKEQLITFGHSDNIDLPDLKENRRAIIAPGLAILIALTETLDINSIEYCDYALREGVLFQLHEQHQFKDVRERTINSLKARFNVDNDQVEKVNQIAEQLFNQAKQTWQLSDKPYQQLLRWAVAIHEIGFDINPSSHHKHGRYIIENADLPGFNLEQQQALAWLVGNQRKKVNTNNDINWYHLTQKKIYQLTAILRLAILLGQQRQLTELTKIKFKVNNTDLKLIFSQEWLSEQTVIAADLDQEQKQLAKMGLNLIIKS